MNENKQRREQLIQEIQRVIDLEETGQFKDWEERLLLIQKIKAKRFFWKRKTMRIQNIFVSGEDIHVTLYAQIGGEHRPFTGYTTVMLHEIPVWYQIPDETESEGPLDTVEQTEDYFESLFEEEEPEVDWINGEEARIAAAEAAQWRRDNDPDERYGNRE
tara:strand:+ start:107 stop:586 length:480 start_codon:yes stop_codon:yes gene_type:complete